MHRSNAALAPSRSPAEPRPTTPRLERRRSARPGPKPAEGASANWPLRVMLAALLLVNLLGLPYYTLSSEQRVRSPLHAWFKPSGYVGQSAGILALVIFVFLWLYPFRKKFRWLAFTGAVGRWLDVHVTTALTLPLLLAIHAAWRFEGLIGLGFASILVVCASGIVGRYLYSRIPRSRSGIELTREELTAERRSLLTVIAGATGINPQEIERSLNVNPAPYTGLGVVATLVHMVRDDLGRWRTARELTRRWSARAGTAEDRAAVRRAVKLASREMALTQQSRMLESTQRLFRYWHVAHRPFALTALAAVMIHVAVVIALGVTWLW